MIVLLDLWSIHYSFRPKQTVGRLSQRIHIEMLIDRLRDTFALRESAFAVSLRLPYLEGFPMYCTSACGHRRTIFHVSRNPSTRRCLQRTSCRWGGMSSL